MSDAHSLRVQLTAAFVIVASIAVVGAAVGMSRVVSRSVWGPLDARLAEEAETLAALRGMNDHAVDTAVALIAAETNLGVGKFIVVTTGDGRVLTSAGTVPDSWTRSVPVLSSGHDNVAFDPASRSRAAIEPVTGGGHVLVGVRVDKSIRAIRQAQLMIAISAIGLLLLLATLAWLITTRATRELERIAAELESIEVGTLSRRLLAQRTTEVDRLARVLNRLLGRLESAMSHLKRFTADAAHELRTPIAALRARLEVGLTPSRPASMRRDDLLDALEQTERLARLAENLLSLSSIEAETSAAHALPRPVDLALLAHEVGDSMEPIAQDRGHAFAVEAPAAVPVLGSPDLLKRLMVNLLDNAIRHTPPGTRIVLDVGRDNGDARIRAHDDGPGIAEADQDRVFERFYRGADAQGGTGLGLALCREIVTRHRGAIRLASRPGNGTTVTVTLPLARSERSS